MANETALTASVRCQQVQSITGNGRPWNPFTSRHHERHGRI